MSLKKWWNLADELFHRYSFSRSLEEEHRANQMEEKFVTKSAHLPSNKKKNDILKKKVNKKSIKDINKDRLGNKAGSIPIKMISNKPSYNKHGEENPCINSCDKQNDFIDVNNNNKPNKYQTRGEVKKTSSGMVARDDTVVIDTEDCVLEIKICKSEPTSDIDLDISNKYSTMVEGSSSGLCSGDQINRCRQNKYKRSHAMKKIIGGANLRRNSDDELLQFDFSSLIKRVKTNGMADNKESTLSTIKTDGLKDKKEIPPPGGDNIEEQLGNLPDLPSDDDKDEKDLKPVVKQEPGECLTSSDLEMLSEVIEKDTYSHCDIHKAERMERIIVCIPCKQLICPLCLLGSHQSHDIRSVTSMREYFKVKDTVENNVFELQQEHQKLKEQFKERKDLTRDIQKSSEKLIGDIHNKFKVIMGILQGKQEQLTNYVKQFESQNIEVLNKDMDGIRDMLCAATNMITRAITFFSKIDLKEADTLPTQIADVVKKCKCNAVQSLQNKDKYRPDRKFSKLLPSLDAIANICDTIHAEATKVVWSKTTKNSDHEDKKGAKLKAEKRKHYSTSSEKSFKKPKTSTHSSSTSTSSIPQSVTSHRSSCEDNKKNCDKTESDSKKDSGPGSKISQHRKSVDSTASGTTDPYDSESDKSESSACLPPKLKLVEIKATSIETGKCLLAKMSEEHDAEEKVFLGKVVDSFKMKETTQYTVNWFKGHLGKDTVFEIRKKQEPVHSSSVICNFEFDSSKPMSAELKNELLLAKEFFNTKKTRKRKPSQTKEKISPKKATK